MNGPIKTTSIHGAEAKAVVMVGTKLPCDAGLYAARRAAAFADNAERLATE
jgi:hypothetical protein